MSGNEASFQRFGEIILEEILVRSGIAQPHLDEGDNPRVSLDFNVRADEATGAVVVEGNHYDGTPFTLRLRTGS